MICRPAQDPPVELSFDELPAFDELPEAFRGIAAIDLPSEVRAAAAAQSRLSPSFGWGIAALHR